MRTMTTGPADFVTKKYLQSFDRSRLCGLSAPGAVEKCTLDRLFLFILPTCAYVFSARHLSRQHDAPALRVGRSAVGQPRWSRDTETGRRSACGYPAAGTGKPRHSSPARADSHSLTHSHATSPAQEGTLDTPTGRDLASTSSSCSSPLTASSSRSATSCTPEQAFSPSASPAEHEGAARNDTDDDYDYDEIISVPKDSRSQVSALGLERKGDGEACLVSGMHHPACPRPRLVVLCRSCAHAALRLTP